jgi:replicative DNA helicase
MTFLTDKAVKAHKWLARLARKGRECKPLYLTDIDALNAAITAEIITELLRENRLMRTFLEAAPIVVAAATQAQADKAALQTQLDTANGTIVTLTANQLTPETVAMQQTVIDAAEKLSPSAPPADPAIASA